MERLLIVNADDFGLSKEVNEGIIDSFSHGCVTSTSLMTDRSAFDDAVEKIRENPSLDVGIHLDLIKGKAGKSLPSLLAQRLFRKEALRKKIYSEFENQIKKALAYDINVTHLDTEKHLHIFPFILEIVLDLARKYNINNIRLPFETITSLRAISLRQLSKIFFSYLFYKKASGLIKKSGLSHPDFFYGIAFSNNYSLERLKWLVDNLSPGVSEISCHPSIKARNTAMTTSFINDESRDKERMVLTDPLLRNYILESRISLIKFSQLKALKTNAK